jgi:3D (Asp-Asp-Asp) domain-containing protein
MENYNGRKPLRYDDLAVRVVLILATGFIMGYLAGYARAVDEMPAPAQPTETVVAVAPAPAPVVRVIEAEKVEMAAPPAEPQLEPLGEFKITHYCPCELCCGEWADGITATGTTAREGRTIAVDPTVIPYGTEVVVRYDDGTEAVYIAEDCGGRITGNRIDVYMTSHTAAMTEGVKSAEIYILKEA